MSLAPALEQFGDPARPVLIWRLPHPMIAISTAPHGGGIGTRSWIVNAQVPSDYSRTDLDAHVAEISVALGCTGPGIGMLTAADVEHVTSATDGGVHVYATVGLQHPMWAAAPDDVDAGAVVGTINVVACLPVRLTDAALVNAATTITEAKVQALLERGVPGTGTASDAVCVLAPDEEPCERFGGPRSSIGAALARASYGAILEGARR